MTLSEAMEFIQSAGWLGCRPGLERITDLMERLGDPQKELRYVHITGTNGKGSTAAMLSAVLQQAGYRVGLFISPHLRLYNERIQIDGRMISDQDLCAAAEAVKAASDRMARSPTEFERFTAIALLHFQRKNCDIVVLEVGLGGSLDSTNVIPSPEAAVITQIGLEHTEYLGNTLEEIAATKAGIIAGMLGGFFVTVGWKLAGQPFGLGATVPGAITCGVLLAAVSLATFRSAPAVTVDPNC